MHGGDHIYKLLTPFYDKNRILTYRKFIIIILSHGFGKTHVKISKHKTVLHGCLSAFLSTMKKA